MLEAAFTAGLLSEGADVESHGVLPTPALARAARRTGGPAAVISASHNPYVDNGIKVFGPGGIKLDSENEAAIEDAWAMPSAPPAGGVGVHNVVADAAERYVEEVGMALDGRRLDGVSVVVDCANGAASPVAAAAFERHGATVEVIHASPDGTNINDGCGSTDPGDLREVVVDRGADVGMAFDGDADRMVAVDGSGQVVDGDRLLALFAVDMKSRGELRGDAVVVTVMTNLGFNIAMEETGIDVIETPVGDRHVAAALDERNLSLGGEQSGHLIFHDRLRTGDGVQSALLLADLLARTDTPLAELASAAMERVPQVLLNVPVSDGPADVAAELAHELEACRRTLGERGRILLRPSGTEPLIRVMVEALDQEMADAVAESLAAEVTRRWGRHPSR